MAIVPGVAWEKSHVAGKSNLGLTNYRAFGPQEMLPSFPTVCQNWKFPLKYAGMLHAPPPPAPTNLLNLATIVHAQYDWATGVPDNGNEWGSSASHLACTPCVPLFFVLSLVGVETKGFFDYQGRGGDHVHCTVEPSPGHIRCRHVWAFSQESSTLLGGRLSWALMWFESCVWNVFGMAAALTMVGTLWPKKQNLMILSANITKFTRHSLNFLYYFRPARLQDETAPRNMLKSIRKMAWKTRKRIRTTIRSVSETF